MSNNSFAIQTNKENQKKKKNTGGGHLFIDSGWEEG